MIKNSYSSPPPPICNLKIRRWGFYLLTSLFVFQSCQKDDFVEDKKSFINPNQELVFNRISLEELQANEKLLKTLNKVVGVEKNSTNRIITSSEGFSLDNGNSLLITTKDSTYHSYTFTLTRNNPEYKLENLVLSLNINRDYDAYFVGYHITEAGKDSLNRGIAIDIKGKYELKPIRDSIFLNQVLTGENVGAGDTAGKCGASYIIGTCNCGGYHTFADILSSQDPEDECDCPETIEPTQTVLNFDNCSGDSGSGDESGGDIGNGEGSSNNNTSGNYGGTSNNNNTVVTSPINCYGRNCPPELEWEWDLDEDDPCEVLTGVTDDLGLQNDLAYLKTKTDSIQEYAYEIEYKYNSDDQEYQYSTNLRTSSSNFNVRVATGGFIQGQAHNHPRNGLAIPSWGDLNWTNTCENNNITFHDGNAYNIVIVNDPENTNSTITYAVTISDLNALQTQIELEMSKEDIQAETNSYRKVDLINKKFGLEFESVQTNSSGLQKKFLEVFSNYGINLFIKNEQSGEWEKLKLENGQLATEPCQN